MTEASTDDVIRLTHMSHCNQGEYQGSCKYGEHETCPALAPVPDLPEGVSESDLSDDEQHRRRLGLLAQHSEAARAGFFAAGKDMLETMQASGRVPEAAACVMTGAVEMAVQLWVEIGEQVGLPPKIVKRNFQKEVGRFFRKHERLQERAKAAAKKGAIEA